MRNWSPSCRPRDPEYFSLGRLDEADALYASLHARNALDIADAACVQSKSLYMRGRGPQALALVMDLLARLGLSPAHEESAQETQRRVDVACEWVREHAGVAATLPRASEDRRIAAVAALLNRGIRTAYFAGDHATASWLLLEAHRLWIDHGAIGALVPCLVRMNIMLVGQRGDYRTGYELGRHAIAAGEAYGWEPHTSEAHQVFCISASRWHEPLETTYGHALRARQGLPGAESSTWGVGRPGLAPTSTSWRPFGCVRVATAEIG